jgi:hypothetical protein
MSHGEKWELAICFVTIANENGPVLWLWRSVFQKLAPSLIVDIEAHIKVKFGQGTAVRKIDDELLTLITPPTNWLLKVDRSSHASGCRRHHQPSCGNGFPYPIGSRALYYRVVFSGMSGNWADRTAGSGTRQTHTDDPHHIAKVRVSGSNPVIRSKWA